jgi:hypothetical protein
LNRRHQPVKLGRFLLELLAARFSSAGKSAPGDCSPTRPIQPSASLLRASGSRRIQRTLFDRERGLRDILDPLGDGVAVERSGGEAAENQEMESSGEKFGLDGWQALLPIQDYV